MMDDDYPDYDGEDEDDDCCVHGVSFSEDCEECDEDDGDED